MASRLIKVNKLLLMVGYKCNNNCIFCSADSHSKSHINRITQEICREIISSRHRYKTIEFIGGEFTIRKDAILLVSVAKRSGYDIISMETNGRMFSVKKFASEITQAGLNQVTFSIHGACAETHDKITRTDNSFSQCISGLDNINKYNIHICVNFVVNKFNYREIPQFLKQMDKFNKIRRIFLSFVRPVGHLDKDMLKIIVPSYTETLPFLKIAENNKKVQFQYIPMCIFNSDKVSSQNHKKYTYKNYGLFEDKSNLYSSLANEFIKQRFCKDCRKGFDCMGIPKAYGSLYRGEQFKPFLV